MLFQLIIIQIITFFAIVLILKKLLYSETAKEAERLRILKDEFSRKEKELQLKIALAKNETEEKIANAGKEAKAYLEKREKEAGELKDAIISKARASAEDMIKAAVNSKEKMKEEMCVEIKKNIPASAVRIFKEALPDRARQIIHEDLVEDVLVKIKKLDKAMFRTKAERGESAVSPRGELVTPYPIKKAAKDKLVGAISERCGGAVALVEREDPGLIAGIIVKLGSLVIDGSLESRLRQVEERLG